MSVPTIGLAPPIAQRALGPVPRASVPVAVGFAVLAFCARSPGPDAALAAGFAAVLVVLAAIDLSTRRIPNRIVLTATVLTLVGQLAISPARGPQVTLAALAAGTAFLVPSLLNGSLMGMGDVKLAVLLGAGLGWGAVGAIVLGFLAVFPFALGSLIRHGGRARGATLPFGPFLAFGALVVLIVPGLLGLAG